MTFSNVTHSTSTANSGQPEPCDRPAGTVDGDLLVAVVTIPTLTNTNSVVTPPSGWTTIGHFHATATSGIGLTQAWFLKVAATEPASYTFTATNIGASRSLVQIVRGTGRDGTTVSTSQARSSSTSATPTGALTAGAGTWDLLYAGSNRSNHTFTGPDTELDDYQPGANTSSALYTVADQPAGSYSKTMTASGSSSTGLGVLVAFHKYEAPPVKSPIRYWTGVAWAEARLMHSGGGPWVEVALP